LCKHPEIPPLKTTNFYRFFFTLLLALGLSTGNAQSFVWELGGGIGAANYMGEIGGTLKTKDWGGADIAYKASRLTVAGFGRRMLSYRFYANFQLSYIWIYANDSYAIGTGREFRNQSFTNHMGEGLAMLEWHPFIIKDLGGKKTFNADMHIFFASGAGMIYHNPTAIINGSKVSLPPLVTEGPGKSYGAFQFVVPVAMGAFVTFKGRNHLYRISKQGRGKGLKVHRIGITVNYRYTYFDYLDDISSTYPDISVFNGNQTAIDASHRAYSRKTGKPTPYPNAGTKRGSSGVNDHYFTGMIYYSRKILSKNKKAKYSYRQEQFGKVKRRKKNK